MPGNLATRRCIRQAGWEIPVGRFPGTADAGVSPDSERDSLAIIDFPQAHIASELL